MYIDLIFLELRRTWLRADEVIHFRHGESFTHGDVEEFKEEERLFFCHAVVMSFVFSQNLFLSSV
jgi:hypothetical protein